MEQNQPTGYVDHIALRLSDIPYFVEFFEIVFGMSVTRTLGPENAPSSVWLDGGILLLSDTCNAPTEGEMHHLGMIVPDVQETLEKAKSYGAGPTPGKGSHWFRLPCGLNFELKTKN